MDDRIFNHHLIRLLLKVASIGGKATIRIRLPKLWDPELDGHCIHNNVLFLTDCALSIVSDFIILTLQMPLVWALQMPTRRKIEISRPSSPWDPCA